MGLTRAKAMQPSSPGPLLLLLAGLLVVGSPRLASGATARVRVIVSASFSKEDCDAGLAAFKKVAEELKI